MIEVLREVTDWGDQSINNGIYHINGKGQLVGYQPNESAPYKEFGTPMKLFSKSRRKFEKIAERAEELDSSAVTVQGSNGKTYIIEDGKCSCPGYTYRGNCKHVKELEAA